MVTSKILNSWSHLPSCSVLRPGIGKCYLNAENDNDHNILQQGHSQKIWFICWRQGWWLEAMKHVGCLRQKSAWASEVAETVGGIEGISVSPGCTHSMLSPTNYYIAYTFLLLLIFCFHMQAKDLL